MHHDSKYFKFCALHHEQLAVLELKFSWIMMVLSEESYFIKLTNANGKLKGGVMEAVLCFCIFPYMKHHLVVDGMGL